MSFAPRPVSSYSFQSSKEKFDTNHPLFHWMFRASRNWSGIQPLIDGMAHHLSQLPRQGRDVV